MNKILSKYKIDIWNSPTLMTWMSYSTRALALFGVLPLVLNRFSSGDIVLWYLFSTIISLQGIADFGFRQTFSRIIAYAYGGAMDIEIFKTNEVNKLTKYTDEPNKLLLGQVISTMKRIYIWLTLIVFILMVVFGTWSMHHPIQDASNVSQAWWGWGLVLLVSIVGFYGKIYLNFLEGLNKIALVRRIETLTSIGAILTSILVLYLAPTILNLVIVNQFWVIVVVLRDIYLCRKVDGGIYKQVAKKQPFDMHIFQKVWQPAWRSGISGFMSVGLTNLTGLIYAQIGNAPEVASYLLALRIINQIKEVSMAPFYSKLPVLAMFRVKNNLNELVRACRRGMFLSHMVFIIGFIIVGFSVNWLLVVIHSQVPFVDQKLWLLLGFAFFVHRFGAMHIQVYMSTNHIISHIADGVSGILYIVSSLILSRYIGIYAVPIGMLVGYLGFYAWYSALYSYSSLKVSFFRFEKDVLLIPIGILIIYIILNLNFLKF